MHNRPARWPSGAGLPSMRYLLGFAKCVKYEITDGGYRRKNKHGANYVPDHDLIPSKRLRAARSGPLLCCGTKFNALARNRSQESGIE